MWQTESSGLPNPLKNTAAHAFEAERFFGSRSQDGWSVTTKEGSDQFIRVSEQSAETHHSSLADASADDHSRVF